MTNPLCLCFALLFAGALLSCSETDIRIPKAQLVLDTTAVSLAPHGSTTVNILSGTGDYTVVSTNDDVVTASIAGTTVTIQSVAAVELGEVVLTVTDRVYQRAYIHVTVENKSELELEQDTIILNAVQGTAAVAIINGNGGYTASVSDAMVAKVSIRNDSVIVTGKRNGSTQILLEDGKGQQAAIAVTVDGPTYAMAFSDQYFTYANFRDIAVVDQSVTQLEQVTWELTCKIDGYRGLQTFMGLEGNLIVRGKHDDWRPTHPIEISGLGDRVMLESTSSFNLNEWMHLALVVDCTQDNATDKYKLFINGVQDELIVHREEETHTTVNLASSGDGDRFAIGRAFGQDWRAIRGTVAEGRVWTVARTAEQLQTNKCELDEGDTAGLLSRWAFTAGTPTDYIQDSGAGPYETNMHIADAKINGRYTPVTVPQNVFVASGCPQP